MKSGSSLATTFGTAAVMYSSFGVILSLLREKDDSWNTLAAAGASGLLYKSTGDLKIS